MTLSIPFLTASRTTATYFFSKRNIPRTRLERDTISSRHLSLPRYATPPKHCVSRPFNTRPSTSQLMLNYWPYKHPPTPPASSLHCTRRSPTIDNRNSDIYRETAHHGPAHELTDAATQPTSRARSHPPMSSLPRTHIARPSLARPPSPHSSPGGYTHAQVYQPAV